MSHENNHSNPAAVDRPTVIVPVGPGAHPAPKPYRFNFLSGVTATESFGPASAFFTEAPVDETARLVLTSHEYGDLSGRTTVAFASERQNVYGIIKRSPEDVGSPITLQAINDTLTDYWNGVDASGEEVNYDNVGDHMDEVIRKVKAALVNASPDTGKLSAGMTLIKLFHHEGNIGMAGAQIGKTTDGFITDSRLPVLRGHGHVPPERKGRVKGFTQPEYNPLPKPKGIITRLLHYEYERRQSSLTSVEREQPDEYRVLVLKQIPNDAKIALTNDAVTGVHDYRVPTNRQTLAEREAAILDNADPDDIANAMFASRHDPDAAAVIITVRKIANPASPKRLRAPTQPPNNPNIAPAAGSKVSTGTVAKRAGALLRKLIKSSTP